MVCLAGRIQKIEAVAGLVPQLQFHMDVWSGHEAPCWIAPPICKLWVIVGDHKARFLALGYAQSAGGYLDANASAQTWEILFPVSRELEQIMDRARNHGDLPLGLSMSASGFATKDLGPISILHMGIADVTDPSWEIVRWRIAASDWLKLRGSLGHKGLDISDRIRQGLDAISRVALVTGLLDSLGRMLGR
jgi:hypothetical protein